MAGSGKSFPLLVLNDQDVLNYLYSLAYTRAAMEDMRIVTERNVFNIPGPIGNAQRIESANPGNPMAVKIQAMQYYGLYVEGFYSRQAQGPAQLTKYLLGIAQRREQYEEAIARLRALVDRHNSEVLDFFTGAAHLAIKVRTLGTVVMATASTIAAVGGSALAAPLALIYIGAKVVGGTGAALSSSPDTWAAARGVAIGKYENGVITVGEASQKGVDKTLEGLSAAFQRELAKQVGSKQGVTAQLEQQLSAQAKQLVLHVNARDAAGAGRMARMMSNTNTALRAQTATLQQTVGRNLLKSAAGRIVQRGVPILFLANDIMSAFNDYTDDENKLESRR